MKKKTKKKATSSAPRTKGREIRRAGFWVREILTPSGKYAVDIDCVSGDVMEGGRTRMFESIFHMFKMSIENQCLTLAPSVGELLTFRDKKNVENMLTKYKLEQAEAKLDNIRKYTLNIKTGRGGSSEKHDPADIKRKLLQTIK